MKEFWSSCDNMCNLHFKINTSCFFSSNKRSDPDTSQNVTFNPELQETVLKYLQVSLPRVIFCSDLWDCLQHCVSAPQGHQESDTNPPEKSHYIFNLCSVPQVIQVICLSRAGTADEPSDETAETRCLHPDLYMFTCSLLLVMMSQLQILHFDLITDCSHAFVEMHGEAPLSTLQSEVNLNFVTWGCSLWRPASSFKKV